MRAVEGRIPFRGYETWYRDVGPEEGIPLLCLHGGPGSSHHSFEPLEALAEDGRRSRPLRPARLRGLGPPR